MGASKNERPSRPPSHIVHVVSFPNTTLPSSYFVLVRRGTCYIDSNADDGLPWLYSSANGRLYIDVHRMEEAGDGRADDYNCARNDYALCLLYTSPSPRDA